MIAQRVLITGAATGIEALASMSLAAAGHTVFATMRDPQGRNASASATLPASAADAAGSITVLELDVLFQKSADRAVAVAVDTDGGVDVVVHNAAHLLFGVTEAFSAEKIVRAFDVNGIGALRVNRAVLPHMRRAGSGLLLWNGSGTTRSIPRSSARTPRRRQRSTRSPSPLPGTSRFTASRRPSSCLALSPRESLREGRSTRRSDPHRRVRAARPVPGLEWRGH